MADKKRFLDVWIVESNTVYKDVPFSVVTDWVQQGRLLEDDKLRPNGSKEWLKLGTMPDFSPYVPKPEPFRAEDKAEALESVQVDFGWKRHREDEDDDVDMIPLIDVSLVLLIFFMMTATSGGGLDFSTPQAENKLLAVSSEMWWIGVQPGKPDGSEPADAKYPRPVYFLGRGSQGSEGTYRSQEEVVAALEKKMDDPEVASSQVRIRAHEKLPYDVVRDLTAALGNLKQKKGKIKEIFAEVSEKETP